MEDFLAFNINNIGRMPGTGTLSGDHDPSDNPSPDDKPSSNTTPPTTTPPTTSPPATTPPEEVVHYKDFVGVPKDSEMGIIFDIFMMELKDNDESDIALPTVWAPIKQYSYDTGKWIKFTNVQSDNPYYDVAHYKQLKDLNIQALNTIKELNYPTKKAILAHIKKLSNNDVDFTLRKMKQGYYFLFVTTDWNNKEYTAIDEHFQLTRYDCTKWNTPDCKPITLPWQEAAFFFIISEESGDAFLAFYKIPYLSVA